jgi:lysyl-tRNA synthetase class 2
MFQQVRAFFAQRDVLEVDTPILSHGAPIATHIDLMSIDLLNEKLYLHSSPEYAMKRLLAEGSGDIYQLSHVFRSEEAGRLHNPEFTMIEWYRVGATFEYLIEETLELIRVFLGNIPLQIHTYVEVFKHYAGVDPRTATASDLKTLAEKQALPLTSDASSWDKETLLHFILAFHVEPQLTGLHVIRDFPPSQAALAKLSQTEEGLVAERFEAYFNGIELANGFNELTDPIEQRERFINDNLERQRRGKEALPIDEYFLSALEQGLPDSCGVAVGFDRLLMLQLKKKSLKEILTFSWDQI